MLKFVKLVVYIGIAKLGSLVSIYFLEIPLVGKLEIGLAMSQ